MNDLILRTAAVEALGECPYNWNDWPEEIQAVDDWESHKEAIENIPAVDAVPVVRCRDCKHRPTDTGFVIAFPDECCPCHCDDPWYNWYPGDDWFCANGERRDT